MRGIRIKLTQRLKFEKEVAFLKYILTEPFYMLGNISISFNTLLLFESLILLIVLFRHYIVYLFKNFPIMFDNITISMITLIAITLIIKAYSSQKFQEKYQQEKEEDIKQLE